MSKLPRFSFCPSGYSIIRPDPKPVPETKELVGASDQTLAALAELRSLIESKGDKVSISNGVGKVFCGVVVALNATAVVFWDEQNRCLYWVALESANMRCWPSYLEDKMLFRGGPDFELGGEWRVSLFDGTQFFDCKHTKKLHQSNCPAAQRFAERYTSGQPATAPKLKKAKNADDDEGNMGHALRPSSEGFAP